MSDNRDQKQDNELNYIVQSSIKVNEYLANKFLEFLKIEDIHEKPQILLYDPDDAERRENKIDVNLSESDYIPGFKCLEIDNYQKYISYHAFFIVDEKSKEVYLVNFNGNNYRTGENIAKGTDDKKRYELMKSWFNEQIDNKLFAIEGTKDKLFTTIEKELLNEELIKKTQLKAPNNYLVVPYNEIGQVQDLGGQWDLEAKLWFAPKELDLKQFKKWLPIEPPLRENYDPALEFKSCMVEHGFKFEDEKLPTENYEPSDDLPILDRKIHKVALVGAKDGAKEGVYQGVLEGNRPRGWFQNLRTGEKFKWVFTGQKLTPEQIKKMRDEAESKHLDLEESKKFKQDQAIKNAQDKLQKASENPEIDLNSHPYFESKGIKAPQGIQYEKEEDGQINLLIPIINIHTQELNNILTIKEDCSQTYEKDCPLDFGWFVVGSMGPKNTLSHEYYRWKNSCEFAEERPVLFITTDFASAVTLNECTNNSVACVFENNNLEAVAKPLSQFFSEMKFIFCPDNDHCLPDNPGVTFAKEAADAITKLQSTVDITANVFIPPLDDEQKASGLVNFNDLARDLGQNKLSEILRNGLNNVLQECYSNLENGQIDENITLDFDKDFDDQPCFKR